MTSSSYFTCYYILHERFIHNFCLLLLTKFQNYIMFQILPPLQTLPSQNSAILPKTFILDSCDTHISKYIKLTQSSNLTWLEIITEIAQTVSIKMDMETSPKPKAPSFKYPKQYKSPTVHQPFSKLIIINN